MILLNINYITSYIKIAIEIYYLMMKLTNKYVTGKISEIYL